MVDGALERGDEGASNAFGFIKKYSKLNYRNVDFKRAIFSNGDRTVITLFDNLITGIIILNNVIA